MTVKMTATVKMQRQYMIFSGSRGKVASSAKRYLLSSLYTEKKYSSSLLDTVIGPFQILKEKWGKNFANRSLRISSSNFSTGWDGTELWKPDLPLYQLKIRFLCPGQTGVYQNIRFLHLFSLNISKGLLTIKLDINSILWIDTNHTKNAAGFFTST